MAVADFLDTYQNAMANKKIVNPLSSSNTRNLSSPKLGSPTRAINPLPAAQSNSFGTSVPGLLDTRTSGALDRYMQSKSANTTDLAAQYTDKAAGIIPTDKYGIVQNKTTPFNDAFNSQLGAIDAKGKSALATSEAQASWQQQQQQLEQNAGFQINWTPGASSGNAGAKAVSMAMSAYNNHTPYVWGGNSLSGGVDCSGLVQQIYKKLGISLPRSTYEQAKAGKTVSLGSLQAGDLVFYNTGSKDPNGIGSLSHVAIYIGNGQVISALNTKSGIKIQPLNNNGGAVKAVRPW
jgi:cell wall-associated NlpC family hydrolase